MKGEMSSQDGCIGRDLTRLVSYDVIEPNQFDRIIRSVIGCMRTAIQIRFFSVLAKINTVIGSHDLLRGIFIASDSFLETGILQ